MAPGVQRGHFVGRAGEVARLLAAMTGQPPGAALVAGPAGVGKTRLAEEVLTLLAAQGWQCLRSYAVEPGQAVPLAALAGLLPAVPAASDGLAGALGDALQALTTQVTAGRTVVFIDDAQLLDDASAVVLHQAFFAGQVALLATVRDGTQLPQPVTALWRAGRATRIDLGPLADPDVDRLAAGLLGGPVAHESLSRLRALAAGNPLFVRELLAAARDSGALSDLDGLWRVGELPASGRLADLLAARLADVPAAEQSALELLAVAEPIGVRLLAQLAGDGQVEALERRGLLTIRADGRRLEAQVAHPLYGELLRRTAPAAARLRHCRQLADAIEAHGVRRWSDLLRWALWRLDGGGEVDRELMTRAAQEVAERPAAPALRERLAHAMWDARGDLTAGRLLGRVLIDQGRAGEALGLLDKLAGEATTSLEQQEVVTSRSWFLGWGSGRMAAALAEVRQAARELADPAALAALRADRANLLACAGRPRQARRVAAGLDLAAYPDLAVRVGAVHGVSLLLAGQLEQLRAELAGAMVPSVGVCQLYPTEYVTGPLLVDVWAYDGHLDMARQVGTSGLATMARQRDPMAHAAALSSLALTEFAAGALDLARRHVAEAQPALRMAGIRQHEAVCLAAGLLAATHQGDLAGADQLAARLDEIWPDVAQLELFTFEADRARAWHLLLRGHGQDARALLARRAGQWARRGGLLPAVLLTADLARTGPPGVTTDLLERLVRELPAVTGGWPLGQALVTFAAGAAARDAAGLEAAATALDELGCHLYAAEAAAAAAIVLAAGSRPEATRRAATRATALAARCDRPRTPLLAGIRDRPRLTTREREVAMLAATGLSNQDVARRLTVSVRTVENHLNRAFSKLGVRHRGELAGLLLPSPASRRRA